jgi:CubicO group peptidase (beta-lactamase class C family)
MPIVRVSAVLLLAALLPVVLVVHLGAQAKPPAQAPAAAATPLWPPSAEIQTILKARLNSHPGLGIVVGLVDASGKRTIVTSGTAGESATRPLDGRTEFEIGSTTKVFTALLLAEMVRRGEVALTDPAAKFAPPTSRIPARGTQQITLADLATHTSGLPRLPTNFQPKDPENPYADFGVTQLYEFLSTYQLPRDIGQQYEYSNLGAGLLGHVLALRAKTTYELALTSRVLTPLGLRDTRITLTPEQSVRLAVGHGPGGAPAASWDLNAMAGAGALRSTTDDMLTFLEANLAPSPRRLGPAIAQTHVTRHSADGKDQSIALGWHIRKTPTSEITWHNGATGGYHVFMGFNKAKAIAVVVLHNGATGIDDIGAHLLDPAMTLANIKAARPHSAITLPAGLMERYAGEYAMAPTVILTVTVDAGRLFIQLPGQQRVQAFPQSETAFFLKVVDAQIDFVKDDAGAVTGLVLHQNGRDAAGKRK